MTCFPTLFGLGLTICIDNHSCHNPAYGPPDPGPIPLISKNFKCTSEYLVTHVAASTRVLTKALTSPISPPRCRPLRMEESIQRRREAARRPVKAPPGSIMPREDFSWASCPHNQQKKHQRLPNEIETILNNAQPCRNSSAFYLPSFKKTYLIIFLGAAKRCGLNTPPVAMSSFIKATLKLTEAGTNWIMQQGLGNVAEIWSSQNDAGE